MIAGRTDDLDEPIRLSDRFKLALGPAWGGLVWVDPSSPRSLSVPLTPGKQLWLTGHNAPRALLSQV